MSKFVRTMTCPVIPAEDIAEFWEDDKELCAFVFPDPIASSSSTIQDLVGDFGQPLHVVSRWPLIHDVAVNPSAEPHRFSGIGRIGFHTDIVNSERPPDAVVFKCIRPDLFGGGELLISSILQAAQSLDAKLAEVLYYPIGTEDRFEGFINVGHRYEPYPLLELTKWGVRCRYSWKILSQGLEPLQREALTQLQDAMSNEHQPILLASGDVIVINQRKAAHARGSLNGNQLELNSNQRRLHQRMFLRRFD